MVAAKTTEKAGKKTFISRWGDPELDDKQYVTIPGFVLRQYHKLGLTADEFQVMAHIMSFKYDLEGAQASPSLLTIAKHVGRHVSSVRRTIRRLREDREVLTVIERPGLSSIYDFGELVRRCREYEQEECVNAPPAAEHTLSVHATPSASATPSVDAKGTPSVHAKTPLAYTLDEDIDIEGKSQKITATPKNGVAPPPQSKPKTTKPKQQPPQPLVALIDAYWAGLPAPPAGSPYSRYMRAAKRLHDAGYTPEQVTAYMRHAYEDEFWLGKVIPLESVAEKMPTWLATQKAPDESVGTVEYTGWHEAVADPPTLEDRQAKAQRQREEAARLRAAQEAHRERV